MSAKQCHRNSQDHVALSNIYGRKRSIRHWCLYTLALGCLAISAAPSVTLAQGYTFTTIDCSTGSTIGMGINSSGDIVGAYQGPDYHGLRLNGKMCTTIDPPESTYTVATGINDAGLVVGFYNYPLDNQGFIYDGVTFETFRCNGRHTDPFAIRGDGTIVGGSETSLGNDVKAFLRAPSGSCDEFLGPPAVRWAQAHDVNGVGQIVGRFHETGDFLSHGFIRFPEGGFMPIDFPGVDDNTETWGINSFGQIVGAFKDTSGVWHGFLKDGDTYTIIDVPGDVVTQTRLLKINDSGVIVGYFTDRFGTHGVVATPQ